MEKKEKNHTAGTHRQYFGVQGILRGLIKAERCFLSQYPVPHQYFSQYHKTYNVADLPNLKRYKEIHKVHRLTSTQNICYALRLASKVLIDEKEQSKYDALRLCTISFNKPYASKLVEKDNPVNHYGRLVRLRLAKLGICQFYLVMEAERNKKKVDLATLHVHILIASNKVSNKQLKYALRVEKELRKDKFNRPAKSSLAITSSYSPVLFIKSEANLEFFQFTDEHNEWLLSKACGLNNSFKLTNTIPRKIDIGLADYLSKQLHHPLFSGHRNYYISRQLTKGMQSKFSDIFAGRQNESPR